MIAEASRIADHVETAEALCFMEAYRIADGVELANAFRFVEDLLAPKWFLIMYLILYCGCLLLLKRDEKASLQNLRPSFHSGRERKRFVG